MSAQSMSGYFFMPNHIILVGASERPYSLGERILSNLLSAPFQGQITPVNLRHRTVAGLASYTNLNKIPGSADLVIAVTPPDSYDALFKSCRKKQFGHIILIQDWESLSDDEWHTAEAAIKKHHGNELNISVCSPAGVQLPSQSLNISSQPDHPAGYTALLTGHASVSSEINLMLQKMGQGISRHISLNYPLSPTTSADWLNRFGHNRHTKVAVIEHNLAENQRNLFSAIRHFTRHTPLILHVTHRSDDTEKAVLRCLARHCNFLATFSSSELEATLHARLSDLPPLNSIDILSDTPAEWLETCAPKNLKLQFPTKQPHIRQGYIGSTPTPAHYHSIASQHLQNTHTEALLAIVAPTDSPDEKNLTRTLSMLAKHTAKPLLVSSRFSDDLLHFDRPEQALQAVSFRNIADQLQKEQLRIATPKKGRLKTPQARNINKALASKDLPLLAEALCLPTYQHTVHNAVQFRFQRHAVYGDILTVCHQGRTTAALPPFSTLDSEHIARFAQLDNTHTLNQLLYTLNTLSQRQQYIGEILLNLNGDQYSSDFVLQADERPSPKNKPTNIATLKLEQAAAKVQTAAEYLRSKNPAAAEFLRNTGEAAAELLGAKTESEAPIQNVLAPYPSEHPATLTLKNGETVTIRPFTPEDAEAKQQFVHSLSPQARYTRFMTHTNELPIPTLARFSNLDYHSEAAWTARNSDDLIVAISRFSRINRNECEFGITLAENVRGKGLAAEMMKLIIQSATQQGYRVMSAQILKSNTPMLKLAEKSGFTITPSEEDNTLCQARLSLTTPQNSNKNK